MNTFNLKIYASDHIYFDGECEHVMIPIENGQYGILAKHRNTISEVEPGIMTFRPAGGKDIKAAVTRGLIKIEEGNVLVLVHRCENPDKIDINAIKRAEAEALRKIREKNSSKEFHMAEANLSRAFNKLKSTTKKNKI